jgi:hypothetical protein
MAKFINKKQQVYDLQLTTYGRKMLSVSSFKPIYYAFFDDNVVYNNEYAGQASEQQNEINVRIKNDTQYIETLTLFEDLETTVLQNRGSNINYFKLNDMETKFHPSKDIYRLDAAIGDAFLDGDSQTAPSWKVVALQSFISSSSAKDNVNNTNIPQIDITANYVLKVREFELMFDPQQARELINSTSPFADNKEIVLESNDPLVYLEEINTLLLTDNFELEVFEVPSEDTSRIKRKYFKKKIPQIKNGIMLSANQIETAEQDLTTDSVEYYFDVLTDHQINQGLACKGAEIFNKQSYYVDLDFDCELEKEDNVFFDIYGVVTEPEICQS